MAEIEIQTERVDDIPVLLRQLQEMGIPEVLDTAIKAHGNRGGLSVGWLATGWLGYILSQADHRMYEVEPWAEKRLATLSALIPQAVVVKDFTDDRLAGVLRALADDEAWAVIETQLGQRLVRVYDLTSGLVRVDSTTAAVYHAAEGSSFFQFGVSKDHRPDLPQFKVMLASLDPLGMPLATLDVAGSRADDGLYLPTISRAQWVLGEGGRLYVGDAKMAALSTRGALQAGGDYYLTPLPHTGEVPELLGRLLEPVWQRQQALQASYAPADGEVEPFAGAVGQRRALTGERAEGGAQGQTSPAAKPRRPLLALGFEVTRAPTTKVAGNALTWQERVLVIYSPTLAKTTRRNLARRLEEAERALVGLTPPRGRGRRQTDDLEALRAAAQGLLKKYRVDGLLEVSYVHEVAARAVRKYGERPERMETRARYVVHVQRHEEVIAATRRVLGWRLYVTNAPVAKLSLAQGVWAYRGAPRIERGFHRLKGRPLGMRPLYVENEEHAQGLVRLLSLGLRVLTLVEHVVRKGLKAAGETLSGLYGGNPERATARPTTERLLKAFEGVTLTVVKLPDQVLRHVTPLSALQRRILSLLGLPAAIYEHLASQPNPIPP